MARRPFEEIREKMLKSAKEGIKKAYTNEEYALIQAINAYLETSRSYNLLYERLGEWYGIYFPEIRINNPKTLADLAIVLNDKSDLSKESINSILNDEEKSEEILRKVNSTIGRNMNSSEKDAVVKFAELSNQMNEALKGLEAYIKTTSNILMPNATYLTDEKIAAELLSKAGSLERLATMPASTIQLLGAEKALFKHIKFGSKPPKYGILFKLAAVGNAQREHRGKMARVYATKISIALKADYFSKNFIADKLKKSLDISVEKIKAKPIKEKSKQRTEKRYKK